MVLKDGEAEEAGEVEASGPRRRPQVDFGKLVSELANFLYAKLKVVRIRDTSRLPDLTRAMSNLPPASKRCLSAKWCRWNAD